MVIGSPEHSSEYKSEYNNYQDAARHGAIRSLKPLAVVVFGRVSFVM